MEKTESTTISICFTIVCEEDDARGIEAAVGACIDSLDGIKSYVVSNDEKENES